MNNDQEYLLEEDDAKLEADYNFNCHYVNGDGKHEADIGEQRILSVDDIINEIGPCGCYQVLLGILVCLINVPVTYQILIMYFTGHSPNWRCKNSTNHFCNISGEVSPAETGRFNSRCSMPRSSWEYTVQKDFSFVTEFDLVCDGNPMAAFANSALYLGWGLGCIPLGIAADYFGRKPIAFVSYILVLLAVFTSAFVTSVWQFILLRGITGFGITGVGISAFVLASEIVGRKHRSIMGNCIFIVGTGALLLLTLQAYYIREWRKLSIICSAPYLPLAIMWYWIYESPRWLSSQGQLAKSLNVLRGIARINRRPFPNACLEQSSNVKKTQGTLIHLFRPRRRFFITMPLSFGWMIVAMTFYGISLSSGDLTGNMYRDFALMSLTECPATFLAVILLERLGRKKTTVVSMVAAGLFCCSIAMFPEKIYPTLRIIGGMAGKMFNVIAFSAYYIWTTELYPTTIRTQGLSFASFFARVGCTTSPFISDVLKLVTPSLPFVIMGVLSIFAGMLSLSLPETLGKSIMESLEEYKLNPLAAINVDEPKDDVINQRMARDSCEGEEEEDAFCEKDALMS